MKDNGKMEAVQHCAKQGDELTAAEYAEKLKAVFGNETTCSSTRIGICRDMPCMACPLNAACRQKVGFDKGCNTLMLYHPDLAVKMMKEWQDKRDKPKGKTYREDFFEKFPNADRMSTGSPTPCRNKLYFAAAPCSANQHKNCYDCWNEVMPEAGDEK